jgi:hypothetical protein
MTLTAESEKFFHPKVHTGWHKNMPAGRRRRLVLQSHKGDELASARAMQALSNVTTDRQTAIVARSDADFFFRKHQRELKPEHRGLRITPRTPRISR